MSLVAYGASDGSDESDAEDATEFSTGINQPTETTVPLQPVSSKKDDTDNVGHISDSDSESEAVPPSHTHTNSVEGDPIGKGVGVLLKGLPQPRDSNTGKISQVATEGEDELEEEVKPKLSQLKDAPKPPSKTKVKITIPSLQYDSDEEEQVKKKPKLSVASVKSSLTSMLPAPVHGSVKETNRTLLPYSLSKKHTEKTKVQQPSKSSADKPLTSNGGQASVDKLKGISGYGSESDDSDSENANNFFSLGDSQESVQGPEAPTASMLSKLSLPPPKVSESVIEKEQTVESSIAEEDRLSFPEGTCSETPTPAYQDSPLDFKSSDEPLSFKSGGWNSIARGYSNRQHSSGAYSGPQPDEGPVTYPLPPEKMDMDYQQYQYEQSEVEELVQDKEFLRIQGKHQRGKEAINIVDVNADDFINPDELQKSLTEEQQPRQSHKKKDGPTSQQKRKHQITYLAHQAKEREIELKNQWSQNRMTKRQTQAKYGF